MERDLIEKKEEIHSESIQKERNGKCLIVNDQATKDEFSIFNCDFALYEKQIQIYEFLSTLSPKLRILPKFYGKVNDGLMFQPLRKTLRTHLKENPQIFCKDLFMHYKTLINGLAYLQTIGIVAKELNLDSVYVADSGDLKVLIYEKNQELKTNFIPKSVLECIKLMISFVIGKDLLIEKGDFLMRKEYNNYLERILSEFFVKIKVNTIEDKENLMELVDIFRKVLSYKKKEKFDFVKLFIKGLQLKSFENIKKMICVEETHGLEIAYDILIKKESLKFEINSLDKNLKMFGFSAVPLEIDIHNIEEIKTLFETIKPISSLNLKITSDLDEQTHSILNTIINKKLFRLDDFKSLIIQTTPSKQLVGCSEWYKFIWNSFYKKGLDPVETSGLALIKEHTSYWFLKLSNFL